MRYRARWCRRRSAQGLRVIDLSGAWRLKQEQHRAIYNFQDADAVTAAELTEQAVYGLPELNADRIANAASGGESGMLRDVGDSGAGAAAQGWSGRPAAAESFPIRSPACREQARNRRAKTHFVSVADNLSAYSVFNHRHMGEMVEQLALGAEELIFTPHLLPIPRGILSTIYVHLNREMTPLEVESCFRNFYVGQALGAGFPDAEAAAGAVFAATRIIATWDFAWRKTDGGWC